MLLLRILMNFINILRISRAKKNIKLLINLNRNGANLMKTK